MSLLPPEIAARAPRLGAVRATTPTQDKGTFGHASMRHRRKAGYSARLHAVHYDSYSYIITLLGAQEEGTLSGFEANNMDRQTLHKESEVVDE